MADQPQFDPPVERPVWAPHEWITTTGKVHWKQRIAMPGEKCEDCMQCLAQEAYGTQPDGVRPAGLARRPTWRRVQGGESHLLCQQHMELRISKEGAL